MQSSNLTDSFQRKPSNKKTDGNLNQGTTGSEMTYDFEKKQSFEGPILCNVSAVFHPKEGKHKKSVTFETAVNVVRVISERGSNARNYFRGSSSGYGSQSDCSQESTTSNISSVQESVMVESSSFDNEVCINVRPENVSTFSSASIDGGDSGSSEEEPEIKHSYNKSSNLAENVQKNFVFFRYPADASNKAGNENMDETELWQLKNLPKFACQLEDPNLPFLSIFENNNGSVYFAENISLMRGQLVQANQSCAKEAQRNDLPPFPPQSFASVDKSENRAKLINTHNLPKKTYPTITKEECQRDFFLQVFEEKMLKYDPAKESLNDLLDWFRNNIGDALTPSPKSPFFSREGIGLQNKLNASVPTESQHEMGPVDLSSVVLPTFCQKRVSLSTTNTHKQAKNAPYFLQNISTRFTINPSSCQHIDFPDNKSVRDCREQVVSVLAYPHICHKEQFGNSTTCSKGCYQGQTAVPTPCPQEQAAVSTPCPQEQAAVPTPCPQGQTAGPTPCPYFKRLEAGKDRLLWEQVVLHVHHNMNCQPGLQPSPSLYPEMQTNIAAFQMPHYPPTSQILSQYPVDFHLQNVISAVRMPIQNDTVALQMQNQTTVLQRQLDATAEQMQSQIAISQIQKEARASQISNCTSQRPLASGLFHPANMEQALKIQPSLKAMTDKCYPSSVNLSSSYRSNMSSNVRESLLEELSVLAQCTHKACPLPTCQQNRQRLQSLKEALKRGPSDLCGEDFRFMQLLQEHYKSCDQPNCSVPWCRFITLKCQEEGEKTQQNLTKLLSNPIHTFLPPGTKFCNFILLDSQLELQRMPEEWLDWVLLCPLSPSFTIFKVVPTIPLYPRRHWVIRTTTLHEGRNQLEMLRNLRDLQHENIINHNWVASDTCHVLVVCTDFFPGLSMRELLDLHGRRTLLQAQFYLQQILDAVAFLHERQIIYLNWACSNFLLDQRYEQVKLSNFTVSVTLPADKADIGAVKLSLPADVVPPELCEGGCLTQKTDSWGVACVLYEMLAGHRPWYHLRHCSQEDIWRQILHKTPPLLSGMVPDNAQLLINSCLQRDPPSRPFCVEIWEHAKLI